MRRSRLLAILVVTATALALLFVAAPWLPTPQQVSGPAVVVRITGHQLSCEFSVERHDGTVVHSVGEATVLSGIPVRFLVTSADVVYSVYFPSLNVKIDAIPGHFTEFVFDSIPSGDYLIQNAEFAGAGSAGMIATLHVIAA